jgi:hypothetical protein
MASTATPFGNAHQGVAHAHAQKTDFDIQPCVSRGEIEASIMSAATKNMA